MSQVIIIDALEAGDTTIDLSGDRPSLCLVSNGVELDANLTKRQADRVAKSLGAIVGPLAALEAPGTEVDEEQEDLDGEPLPLERMHRAFAGHPYVCGQRPSVNYGATFDKDDPVEAFFTSTADWPLLEDADEERELKDKIDAGLVAFEKWENGDWADDDERLTLAALAAEGTHAYLRFFEGNVRLVRKLLNNFKDAPGADLELLLVTGIMSLNKAISKFDQTKGFKFSTYATWWIRQALGREYANSGRTIRLPVYAHERLRQLQGFVKSFKREHDREPTPAEMIASGFSDAAVEDYLAYGAPPVSLTKKASEEGDVEIVDTIPVTEPGFRETDDSLTQTEILDHVVGGTQLSPRQAMILALRFNTLIVGAPSLQALALQFDLELDATGERLVKPLTLDQVGVCVGITREGVRQAELKALQKLRAKGRGLASREDFVW